MPEMMTETVGRLLDAAYMLTMVGIDVDISVPLSDLLLKWNAPKKEIAAKVDKWLYEHGNECLRGHHGSADREREFVIEGLEDTLDSIDIFF